jgi:hypothetical protein
MKKVTKQDRIDRVIERWERQYPDKPYIDDKWKEITKKLKALVNPTEKDISDTIGNTSWVTLYCHDCGCDQEEVIEFERHDTKFHLCWVCLMKSIELLKNEK